MRKVLGVTVAMSAILLMGSGQAWSLSPETAMLLDLLQAKGVISQSEAAEFTKTLEAKAVEAAPVVDDSRPQSVPALADREKTLEAKSSEVVAEKSEGGEGMLAGAGSKISFSGLLEAAMSSGRTTDSVGSKQSGSDLSLATAQLSADAFVSDYVNGHLTLLYEEDPADSSNNNVVLDEAYVGINGGEACPTYVNIGRMYVPFGHFESHFVSDPTTLTLGETNDTAVVAGYADDIFDLEIGVFKGKVSAEGKNQQINSMTASAVLTLPKSDEGRLAMKGGVSYLSNLATSDGLEPHTADDMDDDDTTTIMTPGEANMVAGVSAFLGLAYADRVFLDAEFLGAMDDFADGDLSFADDANRRPHAWNVEAAVRLFDKMECAVRYGGSDEAGTFLADDEYGVVLLYNLFDNTSLAVEYLFQEFQDNSQNRQSTVQLAVEF